MKLGKFVGIILVAAVVGGCAGVEEGAGVRPCVVGVRSYGGESVEGRGIEWRVYGNGEDVVLLIGSIHGSERAGTAVLERLCEELDAQVGVDGGRGGRADDSGSVMSGWAGLCGKTVIVMPVMNPDGYVRKSRWNANGVDLNRNWPAANRQDGGRGGEYALSEPESRILAGIMGEYRPDRIVVFHEALACVDYDGPGEELARRLAGACKLEVRKLGARAGSLGAYAGERLGVPVITVEMTREDGVASGEELWGDYGGLVMVAIFGGEVGGPWFLRGQ